MRRRARSPLLLLLAIAVLAVPAGSIASTYTIVLGGAPVTVANTAADENINVDFNGTAGTRISVKLSSVTIGTSSCCSTKVSVRKPDGTNLIAPTNVGRNGGFLDVKSLPVSGSYRIFIDPQGTVTGSMVVTLYDVPADPVVAATPGGAPVSIATTVPGQNAKATFTGSAGQRVGLKMTNVTIGTSTTASTKVSLLKPDGTTLVAPTNVGTRGGFVEASLPIAGVYTFLIDPQTSSTGGMTLTLYDVPADLVAPIIPGGAPVTLATTVPGQNAKATFAGAVGQRISLKIGPVSLTTAADTAKISITKPDGTTLLTPTSYSSVGGFVDVKTLLAAGTYTIFVDPQSAATGSVTLTLYDVPPDVVVPMTFGAPATLTTTTPGQNAKATFTGAVGQNVAVRVTGVTIGPSPTGSTKVSLLKPDGTTLKTLTLGTNGGVLQPSVLPVAGTYTVLVDPLLAATGSATLTLDDVMPDITGSILPDGTPVSVTTTSANQNARLTFSGTAGQGISLRMKFAPSSCCTANVSILKPDGSIFVSPMGVGTVEKFMDTKILPVTGTYTIFVDPQGAATGTMTLTLFSVPGDATATITPGGPPVTVTTTAGGQNARLTFEGTAGDGIVLTVGPTCCATSISILRPTGTTQLSPRTVGTAGGTVYTILAVTGTHTIVVDYQLSAVGSVTLQLSLDNSAPAAPALTLTETSVESHVAGTNFFYRPDGAGASLTVTAATSDAGSGVQKVNFPGLTGGFTPTGIASDLTAPYSRVYSWITGATYNNALNTVTAYDNVGNTSSTTFAVRSDSAAPTTTDNTAAIGSAWKNTNQTVILTPSDGTGSGVAATRYTTNGSTPTNTSSQGTSVALTADGVYTVKYFSVDNVTNTEAVQTAGTQIRIDKTPPASVTLNALPASIRNGQTLSGAATDALSGIVSLSYFYCAGSACTPNVLVGTSSTGPSYSIVWSTQPPDGTYQVLARATDAAGNTLDSAKRTVVVDNTLPDTTITVAPASPSTASVSFSFTSTQAGSTFQCELDGGGFSACTSPKPYTGLSSGSHTFQVRATDPAGNVDATPAAHTWTVDAVAPDTTITANPPTLTTSTSASFTFASTEAGTFQCRLDAGSFAACTNPQNYTGLADGSHTFSVRAVDTAGNVDPSPATFTWTVDTTAPNTTITASPTNPSNSASASFSFTSSEAGSTFACELDGGGFSACTSAQSYSGLSDGSHTFAVRATDPIGNTDASPATYTWTVDTVAPDTAITSNPPLSTNSTSASFEFASTEAGSFQCRLDAGTFAACTSPRSYTALADGSHTFSVRAVDTAGNVDPSAASYTWTVDATAPNTTITDSPGNPTSSTNASFSFDSTETGSTFECRLDAGSFGACTSAQTYGGLADGSHTFSVRAIDPVGNTDPSPAAFTWTVDTTAPNTTITASPTNPSNSASASFSFTSSEAGSTFECELDGAGFSACSSSQSYSALSDGSHTFAVRATDPVGNTDANPATYTWTVDTSAPDTTITVFPDDPSASANASFSFTSTEAGTFQCRLDAGSFAACTSPQSYSSLADGSHTFSVRAVDTAGNVDPSAASYTWTVDATAPNTTITDSPANPSNSASASFSFTSSEAGSTFECELDGGGFSTCTSSQGYTGLSDGSHTLRVRATDPVGNVDPSAAAYTWTVDTAAPHTTITDSPSDPSSSTGASFSFTASEPGSTFECEVDGGGFSACASPKPVSGLADGSHTFQVRATDGAGNTDASPASYTWTVDTAAPNTTITDSPSDPNPSANASFSFTASEPGSTFQCELDGGGFSACSSPQSYSSLADGSHTFSVRAVDTAGNVDPSAASYTWTVDATAPNTTITDSPANPSNSASASFSFTSSEAGSTFECELDGGGFSTCTSAQSYGALSDGSHTFAVRATDPVGNTDGSPATWTWGVDTAAPAATITDAPSDPNNDSSPAFSFSASEAGSSFECELDGGGYSSCTSPENLNGLTEGSHTFAVRATDAAGNTGSADTHAWTVDLTAPETTISAGPSDPTTDTFADFSFDSSETGSAFQCELDGGGFSSCSSSRNYSGLAPGSHTFSVHATDTAGNVDTTPATFTWTIS